MMGFLRHKTHKNMNRRKHSSMEILKARKQMEEQERI